MSWFRFDLTEEQIANGQLSTVENEFSKWFSSLNVGGEVALFCRRHPEDDGKTMYVYSGSPIYAELFLQWFSAAPCEPPAPDEDRETSSRTALILLVGDPYLCDRIMKEISQDSRAS